MVRVQVAVYDLLPESRISTAFYYLGVGIYHTAVRIPDLGVEYAYGGIFPSSPTSASSANGCNTKTGIFSLPSPEHDTRVAERLMPGTRFIARVEIGEAFGKSWQKQKQQRQPRCQTAGSSASAISGRNRAREKPLPPLPPKDTGTSSVYGRGRTGRLTRQDTGSSISVAPLLASHDQLDYTGADEEGLVSRAGGASPSPTFSTDPSPPANSAQSPSTFLPDSADSLTSTSPIHAPENWTYGFGHSTSNQGQNDLIKVINVIEDMKREDEWRANQYQLLLKNCNDFTHELCRRLTGKSAPGWINRAAWVGQSLPCLVPEGWLDPPTAAETQNRRGEVLGPRQGLSSPPASPLIAMPYVETRPMTLSVNYETLGDIENHVRGH